MKSKLLLLSLIFGTLTTLAQNPLEEKISVRIKNTSLEAALFYLIDQKEVNLSFPNDIIPDRQVTVRFRRTQVENVLIHLLRSTDIEYKLIGNQIVLFEKEKPPVTKKFTISGFLRDAQSSEFLIAASIFDRKSGKGTVTNEYGFYSLTVEEGPVDLQFSYLGYNTKDVQFYLDKRRVLNVNLMAALTLAEVVVVAKDSSLLQRKTAMSVNEIAIKDVERLPKLAGESDVIRTLQLLPGIQTGADGIGGIHVRGGTVGQNLILIDDVPVYNVSHAAGVFSIFNTEAIRSAKLVKGGFPARYGGRISSILDVRTREGNMKERKTSISTGLLTASLTTEGPIQKDYSSFFLSGRVSFLNFYLKPTSRYFKELLGETGETVYDFYDFNAKLNFSFSEQDKIYISVYAGSDNFLNFGNSTEIQPVINSLTGDTTLFRIDREYSENLTWGNTVAAFRWNHLFNDKLFLNSTVTYSRLNLNLTYSSNDSIVNLAEDRTVLRVGDFGAYNSSIEDFGAKLDFNLIPSTTHYFRFGFGTTRHLFNPGALFFNQSVAGGQPVDNFSNRPIQSSEFYAYLEDEINWGKLLLNVGLRATNLSVEIQTYQFLEPRLAAYYKLTDNLGLKASYSKMTQHLHLLSRSGIGLPTDLWVPSTQEIAPQVSWQMAGGFDLSIGQSTAIEVEVYHKRMKNLITYSEGANILLDWENNVTVGRGTSYGLEFLWKQRIGQNTKGWLAYTWSRTTRVFGRVNFGRVFPYQYDRTHDLKMAFSHQFNKRLQLTGSWQINTGLAYSLPLLSYTNEQIPNSGGTPIVLDFLEERNNARLPYYHRLDLSINYSIPLKKAVHRINVGGYNVYNRRNPLYYNLVNGDVVRIGDQLVQPKRFVQVLAIPILPSLSYSVKF